MGIKILIFYLLPSVKKAKVSKYYNSDRLNFHSSFFHARGDSYKIPSCYSPYGGWCQTSTSSTYYNITHNCSGNDTSGYSTYTNYAGLPTYEDIVFSGVMPETEACSSWILSMGGTWTMSPAGVGPHDMVNYRHPFAWGVETNSLSHKLTNDYLPTRPVVNIKGSVIVTGSGTSGNPYVVQ